MCQSKENGGKRCEPTITFRSIQSLRAEIAKAAPAEKAILEQRLEKLAQARKQYGPVVSPMELPIPTGVQTLLDDIRSLDHSPLLVGGTVRDALAGGIVPKDFDIEVYGVDVDTLASDVRKKGYIVDEVGKAFGVLKVRTKDGKDDIDLSVPRTDSLTSGGHRGFEVEMSENMTVKEASDRRDFTINAMMYDDKLGVCIDPHGGKSDLESKTLRHVSEKFADDPLRVLRGFQFVGRYGMNVDAQTAQFSQQLASRASELASERIATEWEKFYLKSKHPSKAMAALRQMGWNGHVAGLDKVNSDGSPLEKRLDAAYNVASKDNLGSEAKVPFYAAVIAHDMDAKDAKSFVDTTVIGDKAKRSALAFLTTDVSDRSDYGLRITAKALAAKGVSIRDYARKDCVVGNFERAEKMLNKASKLNIADRPEAPFIMGRDVLEITNKRPGRWIGELVAKAEELQYRGELSSKSVALEWLNKQIRGIE
jgi:tRNA nucleotidyltransferase/poly(A) polymerase